MASKGFSDSVQETPSFFDFYEGGTFTLVRESNLSAQWSVAVKYTPGDARLPTAIILPAYRRDALHDVENVSTASILSSSGFPVVQMNYGGFDHYGCKNMPESPDDATIESNIEDVRSVMNALGDRKIVMVPSSYSINVAVPAANESVADIMALMPFPDFVEHAVKPNIESRPRYLKKFLDRGYLCSLTGEPDFPVTKVSHRFYETAGLLKIPEDMRARITAIVKAQDRVVRETQTHALESFFMQAAEHGLEYERILVPGEDHRVCDAMLEIFTDKMHALRESHLRL